MWLVNCYCILNLGDLQSINYFAEMDITFYFQKIGLVTQESSLSFVHLTVLSTGLGKRPPFVFVGRLYHNVNLLLETT